MASGASLESRFAVKHVERREMKSLTFCSSDQRQPNDFGKTVVPQHILQPRKNFSRQQSQPQQEGGAGFGAKRRYSQSGPLDHKPFKRWRKGTRMVIPPTKFLLGGNINDPLNLESLADEDVAKKINELTPVSSPVPVGRHLEQIEVLIPQNIKDPLNLNSGEDIEFKLLSPKSKRKKKHKKKKKEQQEEHSTDDKEHSEKVALAPAKPAEKLAEKSPEKKPPDKKVVDKIVSPVVPQGIPTKFVRRNRSYSHSDDKATGGGRNRRRKSNNACKTPQFKEKDEAYKYGNYDRYYGYRNQHTAKDFRLQCFKTEWFENKDVLDVGCNVGHLTLTVARDYSPKKIIGIDIDDKLVKMARRNVRHYLTNSSSQQFPISMALCHGPVATAALPVKSSYESHFPNNVFFITGNFVPESDALLELQRPEFDSILCLSLTKWVHLNWGDAGLKRVFKRMFLQLKPGGKLILEAQPWPSYSRKKKLTETIFRNYQSIQFKPDQFNEYLLGKEVGFSTCEVINTPAHPSKGFCRAMYLFTKSECCLDEEAIQNVTPKMD